MTEISRNKPCPCGSGKKYKNCCLQTDSKKSETVIKISHNRFNLYSLILIAIMGLMCYSNTFNNSFQFDDTVITEEKLTLAHLDQLWDKNTSRFVTSLTFALNYHFGKLDVQGYHIANIAIHMINGLLVFWFMLLLLHSGSGKKEIPANRWLPTITALIFIAHPIQTQAVTYIVQRLASLAALFYLLTLCQPMSLGIMTPASDILCPRFEI